MNVLNRLWAVALIAVAPLSGCLAAAAAGAGTGIYLTTRGAASTVEGSVSSVAGRARAVMGEEGITISETKSENGGDKQELKGTKGDLDVTISMERESPSMTKVEVSARENLAEWDKDYAQRVLNKIVAKS